MQEKSSPRPLSKPFLPFGSRFPFPVSRWAAFLFVAALPVRAAGTAPEKPWKSADFATATCGHIPAIPLTFAFPGEFVASNPKRGAQVGCFWGTADDLGRALADPKGAHFDKVANGVFWMHLAGNLRFDAKTGRFSGEPDLVKNLAGTGVADAKITRRSFAGFPGLVIGGRTSAGAQVYMLYLGHGVDDRVILVNYRPPTKASPADAAVWAKFIDAIHGSR